LLVLIGVALADEQTVHLHYDAAPHTEGVAAELSLSITIDGTDQATNFVRSLHPLLSLNHFHARVEGRHRVAGNKHKVAHQDARVNVRYDDEDSEYDWKVTEPPADLATNKLAQMIWYLAMAERSYDLSALGGYQSDDPNQDHNGEALDLFMNGVTRLPDRDVKVGETWTETWKGSRTEKGKSARWAFTQVVTFKALETRGSVPVAVLASELTGKLEGDEDPNAEEKWSRLAGKTRVVLEVKSGRIREQWGEGLITAYFKNTAADGTKNEVTLKFGAAGTRKAFR
jgi:hypothetical protein